MEANDLGIKLQNRIDSKQPLNKILEWALAIYKENPLSDDLRLVSLIDEIIITAHEDDSEDAQEHLRIIADSLSFPDIFTKVKLGAGIKEKLKDGLSIPNIRRWIAYCITEYDLEDLDYDCFYSMTMQCSMIEDEDSRELILPELKILSHLLILNQPGDLLDQIDKILKEKYALGIKSPNYDLGCQYLNSLAHETIDEDNRIAAFEKLDNTVKYFNLAIDEFDVRAFFQLGVLYLNWLKYCDLNRDHYYRLAMDAFASTFFYDNNPQKLLNIGLAFFSLAKFKAEQGGPKNHQSPPDGIDKRTRLEKYYENAIFYLEKYVNDGIKEAIDYSSLQQAMQYLEIAEHDLNAYLKSRGK